MKVGDPRPAIRDPLGLGIKRAAPLVPPVMITARPL
jgi:hypothetical protein